MNPITSHYTTDIDHLRLFLFTTDALLAKQAEQVGIDSIIAVSYTHLTLPTNREV